jgi:hypothetical protein
MFIIPYTQKQVIINHIRITVYQILTVGGTNLWEEDDAYEVENILTLNEIYVKSSPTAINGMWLCPVDITKMKMEEYYQWTETEQDSTLFCWRTFYIFDDQIPLFLQDDRIGPFSYQDLFDRIKQTV